MAQRPFPRILNPILETSAQRHQHICPRQVLGARIGLFGLKTLGFIDTDYSHPFTNSEKRLLTVVETDGCGADGIAIATDCHVGRRTLRVIDYGKVAATLIDTHTKRAIRVWPAVESRRCAKAYAPTAESKWHAYLAGYQLMPDHELLQFASVRLTQSIESILSKPNQRAICENCAEEIMNEREVVSNGRILCRACAGDSYYQSHES
ncbi:MAG: FmdE family protein [Chloroflexota bacterium]